MAARNVGILSARSFFLLHRTLSQAAGEPARRALPMYVTDSISRSVDRLMLNDRDRLPTNVALPCEAHRAGFSFRTHPRYSSRVCRLLCQRPFLCGVPDVAQMGEGRSPAKSVPPVCLFFPAAIGFVWYLFPLGARKRPLSG